MAGVGVQAAAERVALITAGSTMTTHDRIMIFGPKSDGTYVIEFRTAAGESLAILNPGDRGGSDKAFPRAHALRTGRAGCRFGCGINQLAFR